MRDSSAAVASDLVPTFTSTGDVAPNPMVRVTGEPSGTL